MIEDRSEIDEAAGTATPARIGWAEAHSHRDRPHLRRDPLRVYATRAFIFDSLAILIAGVVGFILRWAIPYSVELNDPTYVAYVVIVATALLGLEAAGIARGSRAFTFALLGLNAILLVLLFVILDRGRIISPAASRLERERVERLRRVAAVRTTIAPEELR